MADLEYTEEVINDDDIEEVKANDEETDEESDEETHIETLIREAVTENEDRIADYADDPETSEETDKNKAIKKFLVQKVHNKLLDSFEEQLKWIDDADLVSMMKKWKKMTAKDEDLDPYHCNEAHHQGERNHCRGCRTAGRRYVGRGG